MVSESALHAAVLGMLGKPADDPRQAAWLRARSGWASAGVANAAAFVPPGRAAAWARANPAFHEECGQIARDDEARGLDAARRAAARGDRGATALVFRAVRGFVKAFEPPRKASAGSGYPPHVARAMVAAAYAAMDRGPDPDDPEPDPDAKAAETRR